MLLGQWNVQHGSVATNVDTIEVSRGDTIDFITDCLGNENSDSFQWTTSLTLKTSEGIRTYDSAQDFHGPISADPYDSLPGQIVTAWQLSYQRPPTADELRLAMEFAVAQIQEMHATGKGTPSGLSPGRQVLINFCQALLTSNEFLYIE
jgi:hypothetical protein